MQRYKIESTGNGLTYIITRLSDGANVFLQGDDAIKFSDQIEGFAVGSDNEDAVCEQYDDVMK